MNTKKFDGMLAAKFLSTLFFSSTYPFIHKQVMMAASDGLIAVNQMINCISIIIFGCAWNRWSDKLFKHYTAICIAETASSIGCSLAAICTGNIVAYYITDTLIFAVITRNIFCGSVKLRAIRYTTEAEREKFDNNDNSAYAAATIIGSLIALCLKLDFKIMLCVATVGNSIDNIFYILIYRSTKKR